MSFLSYVVGVCSGLTAEFYEKPFSVACLSRGNMREGFRQFPSNMALLEIEALFFIRKVSLIFSSGMFKIQ